MDGPDCGRTAAIARLLDAARWTHGKGMQSYLTMMAVRLLEMRRILKATGSIYLHCDPTASHYLKMLMDAVFAVQNFRNEMFGHIEVEASPSTILLESTTLSCDMLKLRQSRSTLMPYVFRTQKT